MIRSSLTAACATALVLASLSAPALADDTARKICVYDPAGRSGEFFSSLEDFADQAKVWGVDITMQPYTDEDTATKDYAAKVCDGVVATGVRLQGFNPYTSTVEAIGAISDYKVARKVLWGLGKSSAQAKFMVRNGHETAGLLPAGLVYLFVRDRSIDTVAELAGKKIATMDYDKAAPVMVDQIGAIMVAADLGSFGPMFNNGSVDACYVPALAYQAFELWKGMEPKGGVVRLPLALGTLQLMIRQDRFPADFGVQSRSWFAERFDTALTSVKREESKIPEKYWIDIPAESLSGFDDMFLQTRVDLRDNHSAYDGDMLTLLRGVRCSVDGTRAECVEKKE
jgi:hypothetical protein